MHFGSPVLMLSVALVLVGCKEDAPPAPDPAKAVDRTVEPKPSEPDQKPVEEKNADKPTAQIDSPAPDERTEKIATAKQPSTTAKAADEPPPEEKAVDEPVVTVKGDKSEEPQYAAWLQSSGKYTVGKSSSVQVVLVAKDGWKCNDAYPYKFKIKSSPAGVAFASNIARGAAITPKRTTLSVPLTPSTTGAKTVSGLFFFSVCNESTCKIQKQSLSVTVDVNET